MKPYITIFLLILLCACSKRETLQTEDYYKKNETERKTMLEKCNKNPEELAISQNCMNAIQADNSIKLKSELSKKGGIKIQSQNIRKL